MADITGTEGDDRGATAIVGTASDDRLEGLGGNDELLGLGGSDSLFGGSGNDTLQPGAGGDRSQTVDPGTGSDLVDLTGVDTFLDIEYFGAEDTLLVTLNERDGIFRVQERSGAAIQSTDTFTDLGRVIREEGIFFGGSSFADRFDLLPEDGNSYIHISPEGGNDTINLLGGDGTVRIAYYDNGGDGVTINLQTGQIDAGFGGIDQINGTVRRLQIQGGRHDDRIVGSNGEYEDYIFRGGNDTIYGAGGVDQLRADRSEITGLVVDLAQGRATGSYDGTPFTLTLGGIEDVSGARDAGDLLRGDDGENFFDGNGGDDTLEGRGGADEMRGEDGDDLLDGGDGDDRLEGGSGNDTLISGAGSDNIRGGDGNDRIDLTGMTDGFGGFISPGFGQDTLLGSRALWDTGEGHDIYYGDTNEAGGITIAIGAEGAGTARSGDGRVNDTFSFFHFFIGSRDSDSITSVDEAPGTFRFEGFQGLSGDDTINGGANGFDVIDYRSERFENDNVQAVVVNLSTGVATDTFGDTDTLISIEGVRGTALADRFIGTAAQNFVQFRGYAGNDTMEGAAVSGTPGEDVLGYEQVDYRDDARDGGGAGVIVDLAAGTATDGFGDTDTLIRIDAVRGTDSDDVLSGTDNFNTLRSENGNDRLDGRGGNDTLEGGDGSDTVIGGAGDDFILGGATEADLFDRIFGGDGDDTIDGGYGNDILRGDAGNDDIAGGFGADQVYGGTGDDTLTGSALGDLIFGGDGFDFINGGFGSDRVNGGAGGDRFFHLGIADHGNDWIQDYSSAEGDVLVYGGSATRSQFQVNVTTTPTAGADGVQEAFVIYRPTGQILWALVDGDGQDAINLSLGGQVFDLTA